MSPSERPRAPIQATAPGTPATAPGPLAVRLGLARSLAVCLALTACATPPRPAEGPVAWAGRPIGAPPAAAAALRQALISHAHREWELFGRQTVVFQDGEESIPHVGAWEDESDAYSGRVNVYWRTVGRPRLDGMDCREPWSAAFISWVMQAAGVPTGQFPPAAAHVGYLARIINESSSPGRFFVPRRVAEYSPGPGDLVCASRGLSRPPTLDDDPGLEALKGASTHCDLVVGKVGQTLEVIGGNVRNSVSKTVLELDGEGRLQAVPRRPWLLILQNRL